MDYFYLCLEIIMWVMVVFSSFLLLGILLAWTMILIGWWYGWTKDNSEITIHQICLLFKRRKEL